MKLLIAIVFVFSTSVFAQDRDSQSLSTATSGTATPVPQGTRYQCCVHKAPGNSNQCQIKFVNGGCPGQWNAIKNIKLCLANIPGYNSSQPIASTVNMNQAYVVNPCPF